MAVITRHLKIQNAIVARLQTITTGAGYQNTVAIATNKLLNLRKLEKFPAVSVLRGPWEAEWDSEEGTLKVRTATFGLIGFVKALNDDADEGRLTVAADSLEADIINAFDLHEQAFLNAADADSVLAAAGEPLLSEDEATGIIQVLLRVEYRYSDDLVVTV